MEIIKMIKKLIFVAMLILSCQCMASEMENEDVISFTIQCEDRARYTVTVAGETLSLLQNAPEARYIVRNGDVVDVPYNRVSMVK